MNKKFLISTLSQYYTFGRQGYDLNIDRFLQSRIVELNKRLEFADKAVVKILVLLSGSMIDLESKYTLEDLKSEFPKLSIPE